MFTLSPGLRDAPGEPRDVTVVVDVSGSMAGEKIRQARAALVTLLGTFGEDDRFRLLAFSNSVRAQSDGWQQADQANVREASAWVERLEADGGTNIDGVLREAFRVAPGERQLPVVIFLTDGLPTVGERDPEQIAASAEDIRGQARVFAFGVGHDVNTHLLDRLSAAARGSTDYVQPGESVERAMSLLTAKISHPVLTDLEIDGAPVRLREIYPVNLPDLFSGQELVLFARYEGAGEGEIAVTGRRAGGSERFTAGAVFPQRVEANGYLPRLWASRKLGHLTRQVWLEGPTPSLVDEIKETALRYGLPSEYTAYLIEEPELVVRGGPGNAIGGLRSAAGFRASAPPAGPARAQGAGAVAAAARARVMRDVSKASEVDAVAGALQARAEAAPGVRMVGGRLFQEKDGVWIEPASSDPLPPGHRETVQPRVVRLTGCPAGAGPCRSGAWSSGAGRRRTSPARGHRGAGSVSGRSVGPLGQGLPRRAMNDWSAIYRSVFPDLVRFLHRKVWDEERARDLAQETFVRALREEPEKPRPFLFAVAANLARDEARTVIRRRRHLALLRGGLEEASPADLEDELVRAERGSRVREALECLSERDREVLLLWDGGMSYGEIAAETGLARGAVGTTLARARRRLVDTYEQGAKDHAARS